MLPLRLPYSLFVCLFADVIFIFKECLLLADDVTEIPT